VNRCIDSAKTAQKIWAKTPLWKRAEALHKVATILKEQKAPIADCLVKEVAKASKDAVVEVMFYSTPFNTHQHPTLFVHRVVITGSTFVLLAVTTMWTYNV
jgi:acyl-CoA reductase-like NAD-dependent aldehyde dehydrogenase